MTETITVRVKNTYLIILATLMIHAPIGAIYAYSLWKDPLLEAYEWTHDSTSLAFSFGIFALGFSAAFLGHMVEKKSPRFAAMIGCPVYCIGYVIAGLATHKSIESIALYYIAYLVLGTGCGILYVCPVSTMCKYLPNHRGLATGIAISAFGLGSFITTPIIDYLQDKTSICNAHFILAALYFVVIFLGGLYIEPPPAGWKPGMKTVEVPIKAKKAPKKEEVTENVDVEDKEEDKEDVSSDSSVESVASSQSASSLDSISSLKDITQEESEEKAKLEKEVWKGPITEVTDGKKVFRLARFYILWLLMFINISVGLGYIAEAKPMAKAMGAALTSDQATSMVAVMGLFNAAGRFFFSALSDLIGRPNVYIILFCIQIVTGQILPNVENSTVFQVLMYLNVACLGGGFSTLPAFLSDLFSMKSLATTHGYSLTSWAIGGLVGPNIFSFLITEYGYNKAVRITSLYFVAALAIVIPFHIWFYRAKKQNVVTALKEWKKGVLHKRTPGEDNDKEDIVIEDPETPEEEKEEEEQPQEREMVEVE